MKDIKVYNQEGKEIGKLELNEAIFNLSWNADLVHQALGKILANSRRVLANTKDRAQVSGGGRKPWKQKGTGRARHGSIRSPLWKGGGVSFGPTSQRNFKVKINKKMARKALLTVLSAKFKDNELLVIDRLKLAGAKTRELSKILGAFPKIKSALVILPKKDDDILRASANLPGVKIITTDNLNIFDILKYQNVFLTRDVVDYLHKTYGKTVK
ncbi:50S ribosomal protein L4 [Candidatus Azambacteria bacterium RIFCSPHIGHO2_01_FULL_44_55]|nr:MAG: 50S ribosomal protein L4 [Candidatus Azambacteria bacterium RIFCSPLOWO2_01_FULL_44_84]OGD32739.1 MAG: 50S ribosomal protein L4 [Candidatus Azambacteria bacterium RIFCSPHIGHO2_02_FULL_45_18]OGD41724.1 MAG: 50S ribosomal protein L4 [Candidatus Azambacteria bacterium RIFCSPHIGHO2_01_FULL_44_55]